ncbi:MAG: hypothetical protein GKS05_11965 [Nitrospirales bacterium]|nr:hypothetical protein [Nitrospirales bacterium]
MKRVGYLGLLSAIVLLGGCQGTGKVINLNLHSLESTPQMTAPKIHVTIQPFQDLREHTEQIGLRNHWGGGKTYFTAWDGMIGNGMAQTAVEYFQQHGWKAELAGTNTSTADVLLVGKITDFSAEVNSHFWCNELTVHMEVLFEAQNQQDGSVTNIVLKADGDDTNFIFELADLEELINDVLEDAFMQFLDNTHLKGQTIKM